MYGIINGMRKSPKEINVSEMRISLADFLKSYNQNMPASFPRVSVTMLKKFKDEHPLLFKHGNLWSLDEHRKKIIDWLPLHRVTAPLH